MTRYLNKHLKSYSYAFSGLKHGFSVWSNLWIELVAAAIVLIIGWLLSITADEWILLILTITLVIALELINTSLEVVLDFLHKEHNEDIRTAKDIAAGAVLLSALASIIVGAIIFGPRLVGPIRLIGLIH